MKIAICGSIAFIDQMVALQKTLQNYGNEVVIPPRKVADRDGKLIPVSDYYAIRKTASDDDEWVWERKREAIRLHFRKIEWSDIVIVLNEEKNGVLGYIGSNTLIEMGVAFYLGKGIYLWDVIPEQPCREEVLAMQPHVLFGNLVAFALTVEE